MFYAESEDGVDWRKPDLGLAEHEGDRHNSILIDRGYAIVEEASQALIDERNKSLVRSVRRTDALPQA